MESCLAHFASSSSVSDLFRCAVFLLLTLQCLPTLTLVFLLPAAPSADLDDSPPGVWGCSLLCPSAPPLLTRTPSADGGRSHAPEAPSPQVTSCLSASRGSCCRWTRPPPSSLTPCAPSPARGTSVCAPRPRGARRVRRPLGTWLCLWGSEK